jgi:hypothetical protein
MATKKYMEQWERVQRFFLRFESLSKSIDHSRPSQEYDDDVYAFFQNCYHLKDWIKNDPYCARWPSVEALINGDAYLKLCADLCNAQKHLTLTTSRSSQNPVFDGGTIKLNITEGAGPTQVKVAVAYNIATATLGTIDALDLARNCVNSWKTFIAANDP